MSFNAGNNVIVKDTTAKLVLEVKKDSPLRISSTGKTMLLASTGGFKNINGYSINVIITVPLPEEKK